MILFVAIIILFIAAIIWYRIVVIKFIDDEQRQSIEEWNKMKETYLNNKKLEHETKNS
jgi:hypothetical protein